jgi:GNAT superfamily N-acetyltransferase
MLGDITMPELIIRPARTHEVDTLSAIALRAKRHWGYPEHWIEAWREELTVTADYVSEHCVSVGVLAGQIVGFYALENSSGRLELDHFWVHPDHIGHGYGRTLFEYAVRQARELGASVMLIDADPNAAGFYALMGAERCGAIAAAMDGTPRERPQFEVRLGG